MLNLAGDTAGDVKFRTHGDTGLADLTLVFGESGIDGCA